MAVDAMLGSLARKLRALGFDAAYYRDGDDAGLMRLASSEARVVLTSDRLLAARAAASGPDVLLVTGRSDRERVRSLVKEADAKGVALLRGGPLCSLCGGELRGLGRGDARGMVPPSVAVRHREFYACVTCGQVYWKGSHWKKLRSLSRLLPETHATLR